MVVFPLLKVVINKCKELLYNISVSDVTGQIVLQKVVSFNKNFKIDMD